MANLGNTIINGILRVNGKLSVSDAITAPSFVGNLTGNADTATKLKTAVTINGVSFNGSENITVADSTKLPLAGGTMTGDIAIPTAKATKDASVPVAGGTLSIAAITELSNYKTYLGSLQLNGVWKNIISTRHRNGASDGAGYGMYFMSNLTSAGNLTWGKQYASGSWQDARTVLDSSNYSGYALPLGGGTLTGHLYLNGVTSTSSKDCTTKIIFGNSTTQYSCIRAANNSAIVLSNSLTDNTKGIAYTPTESSFRPTTTGQMSLGTSDYKWTNVYATTFTGNLSGNATSATKATKDSDGNTINTTYNKLDGTNSFITLTGGNDNVTGYRVVLQKTMSTWNNCRIVLSIASRHQGTGILSIGISTGTDLATFYQTARFYGSEVSWTSDSWIQYYNSTTGVYTLLWKFSDYSPTRVSVLENSGFGNVSNGTWMETLDTATLGTKYSVNINSAQTATKLVTARTIGVSGVTGTAQSFDGSKNIVIPITAVPATLLTNKSAIKGSEITNDKYWIPSSDASVANFVAMTSDEYATESGSLATGTIVAITDGTDGYVSTLPTSLTCNLPTGL